MRQLFHIPVAHRGLHGDRIPENSMTAFEKAAKAGYAIETDVHMTKDHALVLFHDDSLVRMTGDPRAVADCTREELSELFLDQTAEKIPTLGQLLREIEGRVPILLEIKNEPTADSNEFMDKIALAFSAYEGEYAVQSFQPIYIKKYKTRCPDVPCGLLTQSHPARSDFSPPFAGIKRRIVSHMSLNFWVKPDFISFDFHDPIQKALRFRGDKFCWTVRNEEDEKAARALNANIIFEGYLPEK